MKKVLSASRYILFLLAFVLTLPAITHAADKKSSLVLMPLRLTGIDANYQGPMETALVKGLSEKYKVYAGDQVRKKVRDIFDKVGKETKAGHLCDETKCMQDIAISFQTDLIATASVIKNQGGYLLALSIRNVVDDVSVFSESIPCKGCDEFNVIEQLKTISGGTASASSLSAPSAPGPTGGGFSLDDLDKQAGAEESKKAAASKEEEKAKAKWDKYLEEMKKSYSQVESYEKRDISKELKMAAWEKFLKSYKEDDTYSGEDEGMREKARGRISSIKNPFSDNPNMVLVKGGCYEMGDTFGDGFSYEKPVRTVCVDDFYMGKYEVTQKEWEAVMGRNPSYFKNCDDCPVERVSWNDVQGYISRLNSLTGKNYRLPTGVEWEYAARSSGKKEKWAGTSNKSELGDYAWYERNSEKGTHPVGQKRPNGLDIYDMSGNVNEWIGDNNQTGRERERYRGGSWFNPDRNQRASYSWGVDPSERSYLVGFRVVVPPK